MTTATATKATENGTAPHTAAGSAWEAFVALQADLPTVSFDSENPHFRSSYASLAGIMADIRPILAKHGFAFTSAPGVDDTGTWGMPYRLIWKDGTVVSEGTYPLPQGAKPQDLGAAITYGRRYSQSAVLNLVTDKDDDNAANQAAAATAGRNGGSPARERAQQQRQDSAVNDRFARLGVCPICQANGLKSRSGKPAQMMEDHEKGGRYCSGRTPDGNALRHTPEDVIDWQQNTSGEIPFLTGDRDE